MTRPVVLVLMGAFWPGHDSAGPNQSLKGFCAALADQFEFRIIARDRPFGADARTAPMASWNDLGFAKVTYVEGLRFGARGLGELLRKTPHDLLMMNGFFDRNFTLPTLLMRRAGLVPSKPALLSPRGEFGAGALSLKAPSKRAWLTAVRFGGLLKKVTLHATNEIEATDIVAMLPSIAPPAVAPNVRPLFDLPLAIPRAIDEPLRMAFMGRITAVKNVGYAIKTLALVKTPVRFDLFGPRSDALYAQACEELSAGLPPHIKVRFMGEISNDDAPRTMAGYDLMFMPTLGENFGHSIFESLGAGTPVLISDRTPWRGLAARQAGFDLPLDEPSAFAAAIDRFSAQTPAERAFWRACARAEAERSSLMSGAVARSGAMLRATLANVEL
jgi:glycosyltransferase involved in cell wall biosynthesis